MDHKSWEGYMKDPGIVRAQRLLSRGFCFGVTVEQTATELVSPLTGETIKAHPALAIGSVEWCGYLGVEIIAKGPNGYGLAYAEDVAVEDESSLEGLKLVEKPGFVTFFTTAVEYSRP